MAENGKNGKMNGNVCTCPGCTYGFSSGGRHWTFFLLRTLLTILILMLVFWFGVVAGRLGDARGNYYMMRGYNYPITSYNPGGPLMPASGTTTTPTTGGAGNY